MRLAPEPSLSDPGSQLRIFRVAPRVNASAIPCFPSALCISPAMLPASLSAILHFTANRFSSLFWPRVNPLPGFLPTVEGSAECTLFGCLRAYASSLRLARFSQLEPTTLITSKLAFFRQKPSSL